MQKHYDDNRVSGQPWIICCPVVTWEGMFAVPLAIEGYPDNEGDDGVVDNIDPPVSKVILEK